MIPAEFNIDQTVHLAADQFEAAFHGSDVYAARASLTTADLAAGFLDAGLNPVMASSIAGGIIDEVELHASMDGDTEKMTSVVRGRDAGGVAAESVISVTYSVRTGPPPAPPSSFVPGFPQLPREPGVTEPEVAYVGPSLNARYICQDLARRAGLSCVYQAHNYQMLEDFHATGSVMESIVSIVEPFSHFEPSKVDVWVEGLQIIVRARSIVGASAPLSIFDGRMSNLLVRSRGLGHIRVLRLTGGVAINPKFLDVQPGEPEDASPFAAGVSELETVEIMNETEREGRVVERTVLRETRRVRDKAVITSHEDTYLETTEGESRALRLVSSVDVRSDWEALQLGYPNHIVNSPKEKTRTSETEGRIEIIDPTTGEPTWVWGPLLRVVISNAHDPHTNHLTAQTTSTETWDREKREWGPPVFEKKSYRSNGAGQYTVTTTTYAEDGTPEGHRRTTAGGPPPGGPGRRADGRSQVPPPNRQPGDQTPIPGIPVTYAEVINGSNERGSRDFTLRNGNLLMPDLQVIAAQAKQASGKTEVEASFTAAGLPWLRRGMRLTLTGLESETGGAVALGLGLVTETKIEYREGQAYRTLAKVCWWE